MDTLLNLKINLIQNFYILGLSPDKFFQIQEDDQGIFLNIFKDPKKNNIELTPEIISKFPPKNGNYNSAKDEMVIAHCFPNGRINIIQEGEDKPHTHFEFHLDNILFNYNDEEKRIYNKIYFTCLEFYETLELYNNYKKEIINIIDGNQNTSIKILKDGKNNVVQSSTSTYMNKFYVPKIICFASLLPFSNELYNILNIIYRMYSNKSRDNSVLPIEKLIEQIVLQIPIPLSGKQEINVNFSAVLLFNEKKVERQKHKTDVISTNLKLGTSKNEISFPLFNVNESFIPFYHTIPIEECFSFFQADDIIKIFKYIILEVPILFFCSEKKYLSAFIENFLGLLSPFNYVQPNISILPSKFYGLINSEPKFLFGINENYTPNFFKNNNIDIDKNIIVVNIDPINRTNSSIEQVMKKSGESNYLLVNYDYNINTNTKSKNLDNEITNDYATYDKSTIELINIDLPANTKKSLSGKLSAVKKKSKKEENENNNYKIQFAFYRFMVNILEGYTDFFLKSEYFYEAMKRKSCGDNIRYKGQEAQILFLKELFNVEEFILRSPRENQHFYYVFFHTKLFLYYLRDRIYFDNDVNSLPYYQFEQMVYLRKHTEARKKLKGLYEDLKKGNFQKPKAEKTLEIPIKKTCYFTPDEIKPILDVNNKIDLLIKYAQLIQGPDAKGHPKIKYCLFPKLLFDDFFFGTNYENSYFMHEILLPSEKILLDFKKSCEEKAEIFKTHRKEMIYPYMLENASAIKNKVDFKIEVFVYIQFNWLLLLCLSLWYCEPIEREIRLNKVFEFIDKLVYIEENILIIVYLAFLEYGNKTQCIKILEKLSKFISHSNYLFLGLLCIKLEEDEKRQGDEVFLKNNENNDYKYSLKQRSLILSNENFFQKRCSMPLRDNFRNMEINMEKNTKNKKANEPSAINHKETIVFYQGQMCPKCKKTSPYDSSEIYKMNIHSVRVNFEYKCPHCGTKKNTIDIKYQILLINEKKKQTFITNIGEFKLFSPYRLYTDLKMEQLTKKDHNLKIDNIYNEKKNDLFNYIFYFRGSNLNFDFLIPYKKLNELDLELIENKLSSLIKDINKQRFSINIKINSENLIREMENEFVPINITEMQMFDELTPCYTTDEDSEEDIFCLRKSNKVNNDGNSFSILPVKNN